MAQRRKHTGQFKARVAVEAITGHKTVNEISAEYGVHASQIHKWKKEALERLPETLNQMLDAEAQELCNTQRYEWTETRKDCRAGFYQRKPQTQAGQVDLNVPKLRHGTCRPGLRQKS